jgi:hypothetical protein
MTADELMMAYDVGEQDRLALVASLTTHEDAVVLLEVTQQVPTRVLLRCLEELVLKNLKRVDEASDTPEIDIREPTCENAKVRALESILLTVERLGTTQPGAASDQKKSASKNDDAQAQVAEWNRRACASIKVRYEAKKHDAALDRLRDLLLKRYRSFNHGVIGSFRRYMALEYGKDWIEELRRLCKKKRGHCENLVRDYDVGMDAIRRASAASFWEWEQGSTNFRVN